MLYAEKFAPFLLEDEKLLWTGRPARSYFAVPSHLLGTAFAAIFLASIGYNLLEPYREMNRPLVPADAIFLAVISLFSCLLAFNGLRSISRYRNSHYGLTDQRIMIAVDGIFPVRSFFEFKELPFASLVGGTGRFGSVRFYEKGVLRKDDPDRAAYRPDLPMFEQIENAGEVFQLVQRLQGDAKRVRRTR